MFYHTDKTECLTSLNEDKNIVKQEPHIPHKQTSNAKTSSSVVVAGLHLHDSNSKLEYTTLQPTLTPPSSASSTTSSTSSNCSAKKFTQPYNNKRKLGVDQKTHAIYSNCQKPVYSEYLNSKCLLYIYYKGDVLSVIDDHFKKSFNLNLSNSTCSGSKTRASKASRQTNRSNTAEHQVKGHLAAWQAKAPTEVNTWTTPYQNHLAHNYDYGHMNGHMSTTASPAYDNSWGRSYNNYDYNTNNNSNSMSKMYPAVGSQQPQYGGFIGSESVVTPEKCDIIKTEKTTFASPGQEQSSTFLSAVAAIQNHHHQQQQPNLQDASNPAFSSYNASLTSSSSSSSLMSAAPHLSHQGHLNMNNFVLNAVSSAAGYRYPQYLNQEFQKRSVGSINPYASHLQYTGFELNNLSNEVDATMPILPASIAAPTNYATSVWY